MRCWSMRLGAMTGGPRHERDSQDPRPIRDAARGCGACRKEPDSRTCHHHYGIGRCVAGSPRCVSRVAVAMLLDGNADALAAYHAGIGTVRWWAATTNGSGFVRLSARGTRSGEITEQPFGLTPAS